MQAIKQFSVVIPSPLGHIELTEAQDYLIGCVWTDRSVNSVAMTPLLLIAMQQLREYFLSQRTQFDLPILLQGTPFQHAVWEILKTIPYGETRSYQQIAKLIGKNKAYRAVGSANGKNPISIIIPCHRVIRSSDELGGYAGTLARKKKLLALEQSTEKD